jgi:ATP-binding cassette subfamily B multidrug efflux pump
VHQTISPGMTSLIRWQNHSYVLKQSLNFFQNDFAGRIAQRIMQTGNSLRDSAVQAVDALWHVLIYAISSLVLFAEADWRLMIPLLTWIVAYIARSTTSCHGSRNARCVLRCALQTDGAHRRRLHQHHHPEAVRPHRLRTAIRPRSDQGTDRKTQLAGRVVTSMDVVITSMNGLLIVTTTGLALWLWTPVADHRRRHCPGHRPGDPHRQHVRLDHVGGQRHLRKHRHGAGRPADHFPARHGDRPRPGQTLKVARGEVRFENVDFHYGKRSGIIGGLNLNIKPGEKSA